MVVSLGICISKFKISVSIIYSYYVNETLIGICKKKRKNSTIQTHIKNIVHINIDINM